jgi:hypothetical protein
MEVVSCHRVFPSSPAVLFIPGCPSYLFWRFTDRPCIFCRGGLQFRIPIYPLGAFCPRLGKTTLSDFSPFEDGIRR